MLPPHIRQLGRMWATRTFVFKWRGREYRDNQLNQLIDELINAGDIDSLYEIGAIDQATYNELKKPKAPERTRPPGPTCSMCQYFATRFIVSPTESHTNYCWQIKGHVQATAPASQCHYYRPKD